MIIEYRVWDAEDGTIFPFTPQFRRKLTGIWSVFQVFYGWTNFPDFSVEGELCRHVRYGEFSNAAKFLREVESPAAYMENLYKRRQWPRNHCQFEKEY